MIRRLLIAGAALAPLAPIAAVPAGAETLREALRKAYDGNPQITAGRAAQRAVDENVPIARSNGLPSIGANSQFTENVVQASNSFVAPQRALTANTQLSVPVFQGGGVRSAVRAAETRVESGRAQLRSTEADVFTAVVGAYMDVIRDDAIVGLNEQNVRVLEVNLRASRDRFQVGDLTRTDVAQSEARFALARAQLQSAQARLITSRENYVNLVGSPPTDLQDPPPLPNLPVSPELAVSAAIQGNPALQAAVGERDASRFDIGVALAQRLPQVNVVLGGNYFNYLNTLGSGSGVSVPQTGTAAQAGLGLTLPIFQGGRPAAQVRQAEARRSQAIENVTLTERAVVAQARSAFAVYRSSREVIASSETAVEANKLALEGVRAENGVGTRTVLDVLDAEQELLNSQVTLVTARRDAYVAGFALLAATGNAEARDLGLGGGALYDPTVNYRRVRGRIWDFDRDGEPAPVATSTAGTPAQGARVSRPLDPLLNSQVDRNSALTTGADAPDRR